jgi:2-polyprenyl-3-methyl-5-hydroxy-6-metoxy-1,4-benzoquinol methylase
MKFDWASHWENVYCTKRTTDVSWFEAEPSTSLNLIQSVSPQGGRIIDVGGGTSFLVDQLLEIGCWDVTVLDISSAAIDHARRRVSKMGNRVHWLCSNITQATDLAKYEVWHDRAVFHFLIDSDDRQRYLDRLNESLVEGGYVVIATFAPDGPDKCSGLPVYRYSVEGLVEVFGSGFKLLANRQLEHKTPTGKTQQFTWAVFQKVLPKTL